MTAQIEIPREQVAAFCRERHIRRLPIFGSALRPDFGPGSDIDVLVEFDPDHIPGLFGIARMERELSALFGGRKVDMRTKEDLSRYFRQRVLEEAEVQYVQGRRRPPASHAGSGTPGPCSSLREELAPTSREAPGAGQGRVVIEEVSVFESAEGRDG